MKKALIILLIAGLISTLALPVFSIQAQGPHNKVPPGQIERLEHGWKRLNPYTKAHQTGVEVREGKKYATVEAEISSLPATLGDNKTLIDTNWYLLGDVSGQTWFETGVNLFTARVLEGRVSVEDSDGRLSIWDSSITIGGETFSGGTAKITNDPINSYYEGNCLLWEYGSYSDGWWIFGSTAKVERYLRVIEGSISELWILPIDPKADVVIDLSESVESDFGAFIYWVNVYDANYEQLEVTETTTGTYVISAAEFSGKEFPVTIDPTEYFDAAYYDGHLQYRGYDYSTARIASEANAHSDSTPSINVGQNFSAPELPPNMYMITRVALSFDTASLPDDAVVSSSTLYLYGYTNKSDTDFYVQVQSGMPTYPHLILEAGDYNYTYYSGNGGQFYTSGWSISSYNQLNLNSTGRGWINPTGWTKFMLRSSRDIAGSIPTGYEYVGIKSRDYGSSTAPKLSVTYSIPIVLPNVTTMEASLVSSTQATLEGYLSDDGGEASSVRFQYGTSISYGSDTAWESGYTSGQYFNETVYGLSPGTVYHFRSQALNSAGTSSGADNTFVTPPYAPYNFTATAGDTEVDLTWTKGTGADKTRILGSAIGYPTSPYDTPVYFGTGTEYTVEDLPNGTTIYFSAWSESNEVYSTTYVKDSATPSGPIVGTVTTNAATSVTQSTATLNLNVDDLGGSTHVHVKFQYYKGAGNWTDNETGLSGEEGLGPYSDNIGSLTSDTLYHVRAVIINDTGTAYGSDFPFTTGAVYAPTMTTQSATGVQLDSATLNAVVTDDGGVTCTVWFEWGLTVAYGESTPTISGLSTNDTFYYGLTDLEPYTTYHYRAVGQNTAGISYGNDISFVTTTPTAPTVRTDPASNIGANQAVLNATILTDGGVEVEVQFQWSTTGVYGGEETDTGWVAGYSIPQTFSKLISGLTIGQTYHFRAQVKNAGGTGSGSDVTFVTVFSAPTDFRSKAISSTTINLSWGKTGDITYIRYKTGGFPIDRADGDPVYNGPDEFTSISGLSAGTTYYFRAWSWREGDVWADGYSEDVATTQAAVISGEEDPTAIVEALDEPSWWYQTPSGTALESTPFYPVVENVAIAFEMPSGGLWLLIAFIAALGTTVVTYLGAGAVSESIGIGTRGKGFASTIVGIFTLFLCSWAGMLPLWYLLPFLLVALGVNYAIGKLETGG